MYIYTNICLNQSLLHVYTTHSAANVLMGMTGKTDGNCHQSITFRVHVLYNIICL